MCKLFGIVEIENQKNAETFAKQAIPFITRTDNHGLGIMRLGENGTHIQRWLEPPTIIRRKRSKALLKYELALKHQENTEGKRSKNLYAIAIHGRYATCDRTINNTHPFYRNGTALMHNGIISNSKEFTQVLSTCDSEALLSQYVETGVKRSPKKLTRAMKGVGGYYAAIVFNDNGIIDIWRDSTASLYLAHVKGVGVVFATTEEIIIATAKKCRAYITGIDEILPFTTIRWNKGRNPSIDAFESEQPISLVQPDLTKGELSADHWWQKYNWEDDRDNPKTDFDKLPTEEELADQSKLDMLLGRSKGKISL